ncbi:pectate lyase family protein [Halpernia frigidisoli]|uniref:Pectate lyase n=1 Tax=Halpernia frigidisoli TaxID=1125876 RepID=A0A1I3IVC4_9FLAO|nr:T9SS type A sorting domain-containing protein [Halpernia frigidisoli]SFI51908.1 pectate lyase [Halpernia frigidisoli]
MLKKLFLSLSFLLLAIVVKAQAVTITESAGWLESAYIKWTPVSGATSYNVYYTGNGITKKKIDTQLIRSYGSYFRADVLGLAAGNYTVSVAPVIGGAEGTLTVSGNIAVAAHDRTGFAFSGGYNPSAYNLDGTEKSNAVIIYVTQNTKNTVSLTVTGATANPCVGLQTILEGFKKGKDNRPLIIRLIGNITDLSYMQGGDIVFENNNNVAGSITMEGVGDDAVTNGWSVRVKGMTNLEVRNLAAMNCDSIAGDDFGLQQDNDHIWIHNNDMFYGNAGSDADQVKGDGAMDVKGSTFITISYNHFHDNGKSSLLGLSENTTVGLYITYHHNWFDHSDSRHPRVRFYSAHIYNNYFDGISKYGAGSTEGSSLFVENNYYRNSKHPMMVSLQGTDVWSPGKMMNDPGNQGTFSSEDGGSIKAFNNTLDTDIATNDMRFVPYADPNPAFNITGVINSTTDFDAYVPATRAEQVSASVKSKAGANTYNNFDTDPAYYVKNLVPDLPLAARDKTIQYAGRDFGGDLKFTFNNSVDDTAYLVNQALKTAVSNYKTNLVFVQGENSAATTQTLTSSTNNSQTVAANTAIDPMIFTYGGDATDASVSALPASGITFVKDTTAKTITVSGTPTANVSFTVTTSGATGTPVSLNGTITLAGTSSGNLIQNFTTDGKVSTFYNISGNINSTNGSTTYDGLTLTTRLKIETATNITYTTSAISTLTLVFDPGFALKIKLNGVSYNANNGVVVIPNVPAGANSITKGDTTNLYYIKTEYNGNLSVSDAFKNKLAIYPNPVSSVLNFTTSDDILRVEIYSMSGALVKKFEAKTLKSIDLSSLTTGNYIVRAVTKQGSFQKMIIKK